MKKKAHQFFFVLRFRYIIGAIRRLRNVWFSVLGMKIGAGTLLPAVHVTWPHQVQLGNNCKLEHAICFKYDGIWQPGPRITIGNRNFIGNNCEFNIKKSVQIGDDNLIASGCRFIDHDHGIGQGKLMKDQLCTEAAIVIGNNVWIGANAIILKGVTIEDGVIIAAAAVVNRSISANEIWAGVPAKKIGTR
jgi:acetyltransferase-like isoleucine patch superfamily enzyme